MEGGGIEHPRRSMLLSRPFDELPSVDSSNALLLLLATICFSEVPGSPSLSSVASRSIFSSRIASMSSLSFSLFPVRLRGLLVSRRLGYEEVIYREGQWNEISETVDNFIYNVAYDPQLKVRGFQFNSYKGNLVRVSINS